MMKKEFGLPGNDEFSSPSTNFQTGRFQAPRVESGKPQLEVAKQTNHENGVIVG